MASINSNLNGTETLIEQFQETSIESPKTPSLGLNTKYLSIINTYNSQGEPRKLLSTSTHNQCNIQDSLTTNGSSRVVARILIEDPIIRFDTSLSLSNDDMKLLSDADEPTLSQWAKEHHLIITKVDYIAKKTFRSDPYTLFMCDVPSNHKSRIESEMDQVAVFNTEELKLYTEGRWWQAIDTHGSYETLCYRALRTLKENPTFDLDDLAKILNYCGWKLEASQSDSNDTTPAPLTSAALYNLVETVFSIGATLTTKELLDLCKTLPEYAQHMQGHPSSRTYLQRLWATHVLTQFLKNLPTEDKFCIRTSALDKQFSAFIFTKTLNKLWFHLKGEQTMVSRPAGGMSERNRFGSALDRISSTFLPGMKAPETLHGLPCSTWFQMTYHDMLHQDSENTISSRESWIHLAAYMLEKTQDEDLYNVLLDRVITDSDSTLQSFTEAWEEDIPQRLIDHFTELNDGNTYYSDDSDVQSKASELMSKYNPHVLSWITEYGSYFFKNL